MEEAAVARVSASVAGVLLAQYMFTLKGRNTYCAYSGTPQNFLLVTTTLEKYYLISFLGSPLLDSADQLLPATRLYFLCL